MNELNYIQFSGFQNRLKIVALNLLRKKWKYATKTEDLYNSEYFKSLVLLQAFEIKKLVGSKRKFQPKRKLKRTGTGLRPCIQMLLF